MVQVDIFLSSLYFFQVASRIPINLLHSTLWNKVYKSKIVGRFFFNLSFKICLGVNIALCFLTSFLKPNFAARAHQTNGVILFTLVSSGIFWFSINNVLLGDIPEEKMNLASYSQEKKQFHMTVSPKELVFLMGHNRSQYVVSSLNFIDIFPILCIKFNLKPFLYY